MATSFPLTQARYLDVMTCRSSNPMATGSASSLLPNPLYLSDMAHVDVKLDVIETAGPVNIFYPDGAKSTHMRQKLEDALWERVALQQQTQQDKQQQQQHLTVMLGTPGGGLSTGSELSVDRRASQPASGGRAGGGPEDNTLPKKIFNPPKKRVGADFPKPKPILFYSRPQGADEAATLIKGARRLESKLQNLQHPAL